MPTIRPSAELRNNYAEISEFCHAHHEPVFITKNGQGDLAVMSMETYEMLVNKAELYRQINEGLQDIAQGRTKEAFGVLSDLRRGHA
jgi:prevent-host-death family protein